jgi:hypothetical protein
VKNETLDAQEKPRRPGVSEGVGGAAGPSLRSACWEQASGALGEVPALTKDALPGRDVGAELVGRGRYTFEVLLFADVDGAYIRRLLAIRSSPLISADQTFRAAARIRVRILVTRRLCTFTGTRGLQIALIHR